MVVVAVLTLVTALESGNVDVNIPRRFGATDRQVVSFPLNCAVWAVSDENGSTAVSQSTMCVCVSVLIVAMFICRTSHQSTRP